MSTYAIAIPEQKIRDVIETAFVGYWGWVEVRPGGYTVGEYDPDTTETIETHRIGAAQIAGALCLMSTKSPHHLGRIVGTLSTDKTDAGDVLLQFACFGEIRYS